MSEKPYQLSVKALIQGKDGRILLLQRSLQSKGNPGQWDLPGGKVNPGERFDEALLREVTEETGLMIRLLRVLGAVESETPKCRVAYLIMAAQWVAGEVRLSDEHLSYRWVSWEEFQGLPVVRQFSTVIAEVLAK